GRDLDGWCSVIGHRQMGMTLTVEVTGLAQAGEDAGSHQHDVEAAADPHVEQHESPAAPVPAVPAYDATLPPLPAQTGPRVHRRTLTVTEQEMAVSPGRVQELWTYNGSAPGPVLHGRVGDVFEITLVNEGTMGHSIDFHAGERAPDRVMRTIPPGGSL